MRIIAGEYRGRLLKTPPDDRTRPMLDRVREAVFSSLGERIAGGRVLDLFAGTGSLALEALSRGASVARCVERDPKVVKLLRENVKSLGQDARVEISADDALRSEGWRTQDGNGLYDVVFVDSPYPLLSAAATRRLLLNALVTLTRQHLTEGGTLMFHAPHSAVDDIEFRDSVRSTVRVYGTNDIWYLQAPVAP